MKVCCLQRSDRFSCTYAFRCLLCTREPYSPIVGYPDFHNEHSYSSVSHPASHGSKGFPKLMPLDTFIRRFVSPTLGTFSPWTFYSAPAYPDPYLFLERDTRSINDLGAVLPTLPSFIPIGLSSYRACRSIRLLVLARHGGLIPNINLSVVSQKSRSAISLQRNLYANVSHVRGIHLQ